MIEFIIITSLAIWGIHGVTRDGALLGFVERFWDWEKPDLQYQPTISKPLTECPTCMASLWGSGAFFLFQVEPLYMWPVFVLAVSGINYLISELV